MPSIMTIDSPIGLLGLVVSDGALTELHMDATPRTAAGDATERKVMGEAVSPVSYTHLTLPTKA